jgi:hypothetical protein
MIRRDVDIAKERIDSYVNCVEAGYDMREMTEGQSD